MNIIKTAAATIPPPPPPPPLPPVAASQKVSEKALGVKTEKKGLCEVNRNVMLASVSKFNCIGFNVWTIALH